MTDMELAEEIERRRGGTDMLNSVLMPHQWQQIIAALRRADLAQTEIKGHVRVVDELRAELDEARKNIGPAAYGKNSDGTYNICLGYHAEEDQYEWLVVMPVDEAQARIAELEKDNKLWHANWEAAYAEKQAAEQDAARYRWLRGYCKTPYDQRMSILMGDTLDKAVDAAIDAALQDKIDK